MANKKPKNSDPVQDHKIMFFYRLNKYIMPKLLKEKKEKTQMKIEWVLIITSNFDAFQDLKK